MRCKQEKISLEELFYLYLASQEESTSEKNLDNYNLDNLRSLGLIETHTSLLSNNGKILLFLLLNEEKESIDSYTSDFEEFWKIFPVSDKFAHYPKTRVLRINKQESFKEWIKATEQTSGKEIIFALERDIAAKANESGRTNAFKYMKGPVKWLTDKMYLEIEDGSSLMVDTDELM